MNRIMMRRCAILCLTMALFAFGLLAVVQNHSRHPLSARIDMQACSSALNLTCATH